MCPGVLSRGVRDARWTQIDAIARVNVPWRPVERRLPCQMNCRKGECSACMAVRGRSVAGRLSSGKSSCERMCPGGLSGGVRGARWTQIDAIARADVPCRPVEWRLPCQMNCRKGGQRPCTALCGSSAAFPQIIARENVPWSAVWRGSRCSMDTNRCHRASGYALEARRMAIAVTDEIGRASCRERV